MKLGTFAITASLLAAGLATWIAPGRAQGPMWDRVHVNMPYTVTLGDKTLQPGEYTIQQNRDSGGGSRVLLIYSDNGMKFETSAMTIPALDTNTARDTQVVLHRVGPAYYFDKIWIQGKDYGYEFPLPARVRDREKEMMSAVTVPAQYSTTPSETAAPSSAAPAEPSSPPPPAATDQDQPQTPPNPPQSTTPANPPSTTTPQATPPTTPQSTTPPDANSANRDANDTPSTMPSTSAGWLMTLLGGGSLSGLGLALRRKR